eukprot:TRINITY_DN8306_c0_g4_i2.p1 TRINITY_DN8306_c0_g4~~TRINITY_DN8306_c0_g4_i2.p1  ORF type:complete len:220 (-),score=55.49 TRINITY_DN8306_c0_g4_i2:144-803(-)
MESESEYDCVILPLKVAILGDTAVGKTSIITRYCHDTFDDQFNPSNTAVISNKNYDSRDSEKRVRLQLWDTAGQETYRSLAPFYCKDVDAILLVYDITNAKSFESLNCWMTMIRQNARESCLLTVLGNKIDRLDEEAVDSEQGKEFAQENGGEHLAVSAKTDVNVKVAFENLIVRKYPEFSEELGYKVNPKYSKKPKDSRKSGVRLNSKARAQDKGCSC